MRVTTKRRSGLLVGLAVILLLVLSCLGALGQGGGNARPWVKGELMISVAAGTQRADVDTIAASVNASVVRVFTNIDALHTRDTYQLRIGSGNVDDAVTVAAVDKLKTNAKVLYSGYNLIYKLMADSTPNDTRYNEQWSLQVLKMPQAWDIEKGEPGVVVGVIDSGTDVNHPDLKNRLLPGINTGTGSSTDLSDPVPHGTHVMGIVAGEANNGTGIAGVAGWQGVMMLPVKTDLSQASLIASVDFCDSKGVQLVNFSIGGERASDDPDLTDPLEAKIDAVAKKGIVFCIAAGNSFLNANPPISPARLAAINSNIICVASCGPNKEHAVYSSARKYTTVTAPGGNDPTGANNALQILSTLPNSTYGFEQGTSMASPACAGVVALMFSLPGVKASDIKPTLIKTADPAGQSVPNDMFGAGVVDANAALLELAVSVTIVTPDGTGGKANSGGIVRQVAPIETLRPTVSASVRNIFPADLIVKLDDTVVTDYIIKSVTATKKDKNNVDQPYVFLIEFTHDLAPGTHKIDISGTSLGPPVRVVTDTRNFTITPHTVQQGRSFISIPFYQQFQSDGVTPVAPEYYFGTNFQLARWLPDQQRYVFYSSFGSRDPSASFNPPDTAPHPDGATVGANPLGLAFWADVESLKPILTKGQVVTDRSYVIPLRGNGTGDRNFVSWNMIGDPFNFDVPFNACLIDTPQGRLSIAAAVDQGYILPTIWSYDASTGYSFRVLPDGQLRAWQGHWVGVISKANIALVVPPVSSTRAAAIPTRAAASGELWSLRLRASTGSLRDTYNFIGTSTRAVDGYDRNKVAKPPMVAPYVSLGIVHDDWGARSGTFAQDIRSAGGIKSWHVNVDTDQANSAVTMTWDSTHGLPRDVKLTIKDDSTGQVTDMRTRSSVTFNASESQGPRRFTITASPRSGAVVRISNLVVNQPSRAAGTANIGFSLSGDANYDVKIIDASGRVIAPLASRAAAAGDVRVVWTGKDANNRAVPAGTYLVQIRAIGSDGDTVRVISPFTMVR